MIVPIMTYERSTLVNSEEYIGLDVHQATISVAVMDSKGKLVMESILETKASTILEFFAGLRGTLLVTFEEGTWAAWLYDLLKPHVAKLVVCNPRKNAQLKHGNKSDRIDARKLADLLRLNDLERLNIMWHSTIKGEYDLFSQFPGSSGHLQADCTEGQKQIEVLTSAGTLFY